MPHPTTTRCPSRVVRSPPASAPLRARLGNRPALRGRRHSRPCPPLRLCIAPRLGPASSAYVLLPAQVSRLRRLPFAAVAHSGYAVCPSRRFAYTAYALGMACWEVDVRRPGRFLAAARTPLRQMGCCSFALVRGWWWGVGVLAALTEEQRARRRPWASARPPRARERRSGSPRESERATAPKPPRCGIGAFLTRGDPVRPVRGAGARAPGRSRRPRRRSGRHAKGRGASAPTGAPPVSPRPPERPSPLALGRLLIAPARPSPAPRGGARAPAPLPGLR